MMNLPQLVIERQQETKLLTTRDLVQGRWYVIADCIYSASFLACYGEYGPNTFSAGLLVYISEMGGHWIVGGTAVYHDALTVCRYYHANMDTVRLHDGRLYADPLPSDPPIINGDDAVEGRYYEVISGPSGPPKTTTIGYRSGNVLYFTPHINGVMSSTISKYTLRLIEDGDRGIFGEVQEVIHDSR